MVLNADELVRGLKPGLAKFGLTALHGLLLLKDYRCYFALLTCFSLREYPALIAATPANDTT
jgi:hypothetical protein